MRVTKETNELARKKVKDENTISYANIKNWEKGKPEADTVVLRKEQTSIKVEIMNLQIISSLPLKDMFIWLIIG